MDRNWKEELTDLEAQLEVPALLSQWLLEELDRVSKYTEDVGNTKQLSCHSENTLSNSRMHFSSVHGHLLRQNTPDKPQWMWKGWNNAEYIP